MRDKWFAQRTQVQVNLRWKSAVAVDVGVRRTSCSGFSWLVWRVASARCSSTHKVKAHLRHTLVVLVVILVEFHRYLVPAPLMCNQKVRKKVCLRAQSAPFFVATPKAAALPSSTRRRGGRRFMMTQKTPRDEALRRLATSLRSGLVGASGKRWRSIHRSPSHALCFHRLAPDDFLE